MIQAVTLRLEAEMRKRLDQLAKATGRSRAALADVLPVVLST